MGAAKAAYEESEVRIDELLGARWISCRGSWRVAAFAYVQSWRSLDTYSSVTKPTDGSMETETVELPSTR